MHMYMYGPRHFLKLLGDLLLLCLFCLSLTSCIALSDLLVSRQVGEVADNLSQLWELTLRVLDDVKVHTKYVYACMHVLSCNTLGFI